MVKIGVCGSTGRIGKEILKLLGNNTQHKLSGVYNHYCTLTELNNLCKKSEIIVDFSSAELIQDLLKNAVSSKTKLVIGTTGLTGADKLAMEEAAKEIPIFYSANMSATLHIMNYALKTVSKKLIDYDVEILEMHHKKKKDSPSGTAILLAESIKEAKGDQENRVEVHSLRAGKVIGKHEVMFVGNDEIFSLKHEALNRSLFARGALLAVNWLIDKDPGLYSFEDLLS